MPKTTPEGKFPFNKSKCFVELWEKGNATDYSYVYNIGVKAGHGATESYEVQNNPKDDFTNYIEITGNPNSDIMKYNYMYIDYGTVGDGKKAYFVKHKKILNYPEFDAANKMYGWYAVGFTLELDFWETYKDRIGQPTIKLDRVTTNNPEGWEDCTRYQDDIMPFSVDQRFTSQLHYHDWKKIVGWQAKKPDEQDNFIVDGFPTTLQFSESTDDYKNAVNELANGSPAQTNVWKTYVCCNTYIVSSFFDSSDGGKSQDENINAPCPLASGLHGRLNYYPYRRAFIRTIDGQNIELNPNRFRDFKIPQSVVCDVFHSMTPQPNSCIVPRYTIAGIDDFILFSAYPTMDMTGKNISPVSHLIDLHDKFLQFKKDNLGPLANFI